MIVIQAFATLYVLLLTVTITYTVINYFKECEFDISLWFLDILFLLACGVGIYFIWC